MITPSIITRFAYTCKNIPTTHGVSKIFVPRVLYCKTKYTLATENGIFMMCLCIREEHITEIRIT